MTIQCGQASDRDSVEDIILDGLPGKVYRFGDDWLERPYRGRNDQTSGVGACGVGAALYTVQAYTMGNYGYKTCPGADSTF